MPANPDSETTTVAFTTGSIAPASVRLANASLTFEICASKRSLRNPLYTRIVNIGTGKKLLINVPSEVASIRHLEREIILPFERQGLLASSL